MKPSGVILLVLLSLYITSIFASNFILKQTYNKLDKSDSYWNYSKISEKPFHHLKISGGNLARIIYEPGASCSVRTLNYIDFYLKDRVKTTYQHDTLLLEISDNHTAQSLKDWIRQKVLIRIFSPQLLSVQGVNTNLELSKWNQKDLDCSLAGKSQLEVESYIPELDHITVRAQDSSKIGFEMAPELNGSNSMRLKTLDARVQGNSLLDVGHFSIKDLRYTLEDTSAIILSGNTLHAMPQR